MATSKVSNEVLELQAKMNANAIMVVGSIALINNGAAGDNSRDKVIKAVATGNPMEEDCMVRLTVLMGTRTYKNIRVSGKALAKSAIDAGVKNLINSTINVQICELKAGEKAIARKAGSEELEIIQLENDRNQVVGSYFVTAGLNESVANAIASRKSAEAAF